jgi:hypothetical protein
LWDIICFPANEQQGVRKNGNSDHIAASAIDRGSSATLAAGLAYQLDSISHRLAEVAAEQLKTSEAAALIQYGGLHSGLTPRQW